MYMETVSYADSGINPDWQDQAVCGTDPDVDPKWFFPARGDTTSVKKAKAACERCSVTDDCLAYALWSGEPFGIWGGLSARQRRALRRENRKTTPIPITRESYNDWPEFAELHREKGRVPISEKERA